MTEHPPALLCWSSGKDSAWTLHLLRRQFHTFDYDGPMFRHPVPIRSGDIVARDGFVFADLLVA